MTPVAEGVFGAVPSAPRAIPAEVGALLVAVGAMLGAPVAIQAQTAGPVGPLAAACASGEATLVGPCSEAAFAARAVQAGTGILAAQGSDLPGSASTLGLRLRSVPRVALSLRAGGARLRSPDLRREGSPTEEASSFGWTTQLHGHLGLFHGFSLMPTVGGLLSLDLEADAGILYLPGGNAFQDDVGFWGVGARVGLLRESFTLPGVSVSLAYRKLGEMDVGPVFGPGVDPGPGADVTVDPSVTSIRAVAGKDLLALGLFVGAGWDRYSGGQEITVRALTPSRGLIQGTGSGDVDDSRLVYFGGVSFTFLVLQLSGEVGWTEGLDDGTDELRALRRARGDAGESDPFDPQDSTYFANLALRLTF